MCPAQTCLCFAAEVSIPLCCSAPSQCLAVVGLSLRHGWVRSCPLPSRPSCTPAIPKKWQCILWDKAAGSKMGSPSSFLLPAAPVLVPDSGELALPMLSWAVNKPGISPRKKTFCPGILEPSKLIVPLYVQMKYARENGLMLFPPSPTPPATLCA